MTTSDIRGCTADIVKAKERRDAAVKALNLDAPPKQIDLTTYVIESGERNDGKATPPNR